MRHSTKLKDNLEIHDILDVRDVRAVMMLIEPAPTGHSVIIVAENPLQSPNIVFCQLTEKFTIIYNILCIAKS